MTPPRSFGVFAPVGSIVLVFQENREAAQAREALRAPVIHRRPALHELRAAAT
jgi:hypothetical protein